MGNNSIQALRNIAPVMAKCLVFAPRRHIIILSDLWQLHIECEHAFNAATEPLLASMRLQWLHDALDTAQPPHGHELLLRLSAYHDRAGFIRIIEVWQQSLQHAGLSAQSLRERCYADCFIEMARICGIALTADADALVRQIGISMAQSSAGLAIQTDILHQQIIRQCGKDTGWLLAVNEIVKRARNNDVASDNLLIFKLFWQIIVANISA
jgi:hypothetical protein